MVHLLAFGEALLPSNAFLFLKVAKISSNPSWASQKKKKTIRTCFISYNLNGHGFPLRVRGFCLFILTAVSPTMDACTVIQNARVHLL